jgi:hypothetical protein
MVIRNKESLCRQAKLYFYDSLSGEGSELIPESIKNHLDQCQQCKEKIEQLKDALESKDCSKSNSRQNTSAVTTMLELHFAHIGEYVTCKTVRPFLPGLLDPTIDIRIPTPITVHLDNCPQCKDDLKKIQNLNLSSTQLYRTSQFFADKTKQQATQYPEISPAIKAMAIRADSEITTIFHIDESAKTKQAGNSNGLYSGFPINVEVLEPKPEVEQPVVSIDFAAALKKKIAAMNLKPLLKVGLAAAALIMIGVFFFRDTTPVEAEGVADMYGAIERVENIYIAQYKADSTEPERERWISHTLNISMIKGKKEVSFVNIKTGMKKTKNLDTGVIEPQELPEDYLIEAKQTMFDVIDALGLISFKNISEVQKNSKWTLADDQSQATEGIKVYKLNYTHKSTPSYKLCFVNSDFFPEQIKYYSASIGQSEPELKTVYKIRSMDESEMKTFIEGEGFKI